jgi:phospholipid transport system substrate-binding protein
VGQKISGKKALVKTMILREAMEIPVNYSMLKRNNQWKVYDVNIEGMSLIKNYRSEFRRFLRKKSSAQLIELLKKKIEDQQKENVT